MVKRRLEVFFFSSRRRHTRSLRDWSSDVCSSDLSAISMYMSLAPAFARIHRERDIVLVDQRGTGQSAPLNCDYPEDWTAAGNDLRSEERRVGKSVDLGGRRNR